MKTAIAVMAAVALTVATGPASAADKSQVNAATQEVETGAKRIGAGQVGTGVEQTAKGVGHTVEEGAKYTGEKFKESGQAAAPPARQAGQNIRDGAIAFGHSVKNFFTRLFRD